MICDKNIIVKQNIICYNSYRRILLEYFLLRSYLKGECYEKKNLSALGDAYAAVCYDSSCILR